MEDLDAGLRREVASAVGERVAVGERLSWDARLNGWPMQSPSRFPDLRSQPITIGPRQVAVGLSRQRGPGSARLVRRLVRRCGTVAPNLCSSYPILQRRTRMLRSLVVRSA